MGADDARERLSWSFESSAPSPDRQVPVEPACSVGPGTTRFKPGDRVFSDLFGQPLGSFAEYTCASESKFEPIPDELTFEDAATLPHSGILALQGLRLRRGRTVKPGDKVLIVGASGNVGPFAVQIAKSMGAEVTGVARTEKLDFVRSVGADHVIDYTTTDFTATGERYDWILDTDSHQSILKVRRALKDGGVYVTLGGTAWPILGALIVGPTWPGWARWSPPARSGRQSTDGSPSTGSSMP